MTLDEALALYVYLQFDQGAWQQEDCAKLRAEAFQVIMASAMKTLDARVRKRDSDEA